MNTELEKDAIESELVESNTALIENAPDESPMLAQNGIVNEGLSLVVERHLSEYFAAHEGALPSPGLYGRILREIERPLISISLIATGGNQLKAAELLGLNRNTLRKKIRDLDIHVVRGVRQNFDGTK